MNWNQFLLSLAAVYLFYYALNVIFDLMFRKGSLPVTQDQGQELIFSEQNVPKQIVPDADATGQQPQALPKTRQAISSGLLQSTGAVGIKQLFALAHADLIEYTKAIPY
ncbi:hypothetical protein [Pedobacter sp. Hv1]|uniref:hypothetical protein n=1 Tax=Pedobacter sp. Hv1 TaxID=1740090 RepID=UPI0006D88988|nr:hypothetical protein [Pedobacter sp. Hv1]KQB99869.1 hypothetical protein AQF98_15255 [Pedobacter sp. Hv1]